MSTDDRSPPASTETDLGSITRWLGDLRNGGDEAAQPLWERYFARLVGIARRRLAGTPCAVVDEEDAALSAFNSLVAGVKAGRFPQLNDRDCLWRLLAVLAVRKAAGQRKHLARQKRGGDRLVIGEANLARGDGDGDGLDGIEGPAATPELAAILEEECRRRLDSLPDEVLRRVALLRMEGYTIVEIAEKLDLSEATVNRKLAVIRRKWRDDLPPKQRDNADGFPRPGTAPDR